VRNSVSDARRDGVKRANTHTHTHTHTHLVLVTLEGGRCEQKISVEHREERSTLRITIG
jgi:hypothetical protein